MNFKYIDTELGLQYLNGNEELYFKILKNFVNRYKDLQIEILDRDKLDNTIHTIKGLSATLGMTKLSEIATKLNEKKIYEKDKLIEFSKKLQLIIDELEIKLQDDKPKTILIITDKIIDIDILIEILGDKHDVIVALDKTMALEAIETENISLILFEIDMIDIYDDIKSKSIPII
ncbi:MAG TPA: Hpt domain-containing protein [Campylobacterales bacterium]|nr:Hpt domain-containing protein [Campylobacterales bacterium]